MTFQHLVPKLSEGGSYDVHKSSLWVLHANLNGQKTHGIDIEAEIETMSRKPDMVFLNETKTNAGDPNMSLTGYMLLCRRDRESKHRGGGIAVFALETKCTKFTVLEKCESHEGCWILAHTDEGPILLAC